MTICKNCGKGSMGDEKSCLKCRQPFAGPAIVATGDVAQPTPEAPIVRAKKKWATKFDGPPLTRKDRDAKALAAATIAHMPKPKVKAVDLADKPDRTVTLKVQRVNIQPKQRGTVAVDPSADVLEVVPPPDQPHGWGSANPQGISPLRVNDAVAESIAPAQPLSQTREAWLLAAVEALRPHFQAAGEELPERVRVATGWPGGRGKKDGVVGQCWMPEATADGVPGVFISPVEGDPIRVLDILVHELVHAIGHRGHRGPFAKLAAKVGLEKPWTATKAGERLREDVLKPIAEALGAYDHAVITPGARLKVQSTRMLKLECPECGYTVRTTRKWIEVGLPACPNGDTMEEAK